MFDFKRSNKYPSTQFLYQKALTLAFNASFLLYKYQNPVLNASFKDL